MGYSPHPLSGCLFRDDETPPSPKLRLAQHQPCQASDATHLQWSNAIVLIT
jgi:hypothetical protein